MRERSNIISLIFCLLWTSRPPISLSYHFHAPPPIITLYHSCYIVLCVLLYVQYFLQHFSLNISLNYHSRSQPPAPLTVSDMIFERSLIVRCYEVVGRTHGMLRNLQSTNCTFDNIITLDISIYIQYWPRKREPMDIIS